ncbi:MAG: DUF4345 domain-containing protein [Pseudomonadota bacterium]
MKAYVLANAVLYFLFAVWCTIRPDATATSLGFISRNAGGYSEYLVIYGGLQLGLAGFFLWTSRSEHLLPAGLMLALAMYVPIVIFRTVTVIRWWPVPTVTAATAALEIALLVWGLIVFANQRGLKP